MKRLLIGLGATALILASAFALSLLNDGAREWLFNLFRS